MADQSSTVGVDEVGRGALAGPLVAAAVILNSPIEGIADSKLLSVVRRESLDKLIRDQALSFGIGWVSPNQIDQLGLTEATRLAFKQALAQLKAKYSEIIIDGSFNYLADIPVARALVKADQIIPAVSAASIIAKVARDNYMWQVANNYLGYGFESNVGYGSEKHLAEIKRVGPCQIHRRTFKPLSEMLAKL